MLLSMRMRGVKFARVAVHFPKLIVEKVLSILKKDASSLLQHSQLYLMQFFCSIGRKDKLQVNWYLSSIKIYLLEILG